VLELAETLSGPGEFTFPLFAPIDMGAGYEDVIAPVVVFRSPAPNEVNVPVNTPVEVGIADYGSGVDASTARLLLNSQEVEASVVDGLDSGLSLVYEGLEPFENASAIDVAVSAADFSQNDMLAEAYAFTTNQDSTPRPSISIATNKSLYTDGQLLVVEASLRNRTDQAFDVLVYVAVDIGGSLLYYPSFQLEPYGFALHMEPGFEMPPTVIVSLPLFGIAEGQYVWYGAAVNVETGDMGQVSTAAFEFVSND